jgi:iron-sulfur cluster repair protein YtfE (RIC family)
VLLAQAVEQATDSELHGRAPRRARRALADLAHRLPAHFAREEAIGYLAEALEVAPRFHPRVEALQAQHVEFALEIDRIARLARAAGGAVRSWRVVHRDFATFAEVLIAHEEAENEIMGSAFLDDIGTCD